MKMKVREIRKDEGRRGGRWKRNAGIYAVLIKGFSALISVLLLLTILLFFVYNRLVDHRDPLNLMNRVLEEQKALKREDYGSIKFGTLLGKDGYFDILDQDAKVVYSGNPGMDSNYTKASLAYISEMDRDSYSYFLPFENKSGEGYVLIKLLSADSESTVSDITVVDAKRKILFTNMTIKEKKLTEKELGYMLESVSDENSENLLSKYRFTTNGGQTRYLVTHMGLNGDVHRYYRRLELMLVITYISLVFVSIVVAGLAIGRKMHRPIRVLNEAIRSYSDGTPVDTSLAGAPREFQETLEAFQIMENKLEEAKREQLRLENEKRRMLADISHDLKTPITVIRGYIDAIQDGLIPPSQQAGYLKIIGQKTETMASLISSFSEYSRLEHPEFQYTFFMENLAEYIREYAAEKYSELELLGYPLEVDLPEQTVNAEIDREQLKRVFENIISNSLKYTQPGTEIFIRMQIRKGNTGQEALITIGDRGSGMPEELRKHVFDPFVLGDESRKSGCGTGLGLSIARKIVQGHRGKIRILSSYESGGTVYQICLPLSR